MLPLTQHFLGRLSERYNRQFVLGWSALNLLSSYSYPGNVRELESILERVAAVLLQAPRKVNDGDLRRFLNSEGGVQLDIPSGTEQPLALRQVEGLAIERALRFAKGNRTKAAALLGIDRSTLRAKLRRMRGDETASSCQTGPPLCIIENQRLG